MDRNQKRAAKDKKRVEAARKARLDATRAATRSNPQIGNTPEAFLDRRHFLESNLKEAIVKSKDLPKDLVMVVCDANDAHGKAQILAAGHTEQQVQQVRASMMGQKLIPTFFLAVPMQVAIEQLAHTTPTISEELERRSADGTHRFVIALTAGGINMASVPFDDDGSRQIGRILHASAFYKNDVPEGMGFVFDFVDDPTRALAFEQALNDGLRRWDQGGATREDIERQMEELGQGKVANGGELDDAACMVATVNIHWLEQRGHLKPDDKNGMLIVREGDDPTVAVVAAN